MTKNKDLFECKPGDCELAKVADAINSHIDEHLKVKLTEIKDRYSKVHKGCITKLYAEQLIETGHYLMGGLIAHNLEAFHKVEELKSQVTDELKEINNA